MAVYREELNTNYNFPNIYVYNRYRDDVLTGYKVYPHDGYVMYRTNANDTELNPETGEEVPVRYYYTQAGLSLNHNFDNFYWVAVPRSEVDENYIFGVGGNNDHEIM